MSAAAPLLILDIDGTVRHGKDELGRFVNTKDDVVVFPEAVDRMREWKAAGGLIIGISNQGGIALGIVDDKAVDEAMQETHRQAGELFDSVAWCVHHPDAGSPLLARCWCRKPSPGLAVGTVVLLEQRLGISIPPYMTRMVGDRPEDEECARLYGAEFTWASDWRAGRWGTWNPSGR